MWVRSSLKVMAVTVPMTTFLYLTWVLLASRPSAVRKLTVIFGPTDIQSWTTIDRPTNAATIGTSHTNDNRMRRRLISGRVGAEDGGRALSYIFNLCIPDKPGIETHGGEHRHHHYQTKKQDADPGLDGAQPSKLHQCGDQSHHQYVEHRPIADQLNEAIKARALAHGPAATALAGDQQGAEHQELDTGHHHAGNEDQQRNVPLAAFQKLQ